MFVCLLDSSVKLKVNFIDIIHKYTYIFSLLHLIINGIIRLRPYVWRACTKVYGRKNG